MINLDEIKAIWVCRYTNKLKDACTPEDECFGYDEGICGIDGKKCVVKEFIPNSNYRQKYPTIANNLKDVSNVCSDYSDSDLPDKNEEGDK